jgi:hypothetical protein
LMQIKATAISVIKLSRTRHRTCEREAHLPWQE